MKMAAGSSLDACLCCGGTLGEFLDFGFQSLSTLGTVDSAMSDDLYSSFRFMSCTDCGHVQHSIAVDPEILYGGDYARLESMRLDAHLVELSERVVEGGAESVVEIGCGAGALLQQLRAIAPDIRLLGVDAARNCVEACRGTGIDALRGFFNADLASEVVRTLGDSDVVVARHVLEHCIAPGEFLSNLRSICSQNARVFIEVPMFEWAIKSRDFTSFTEQHVSYFSKGSLEVLLSRVGFKVLSFTVAPNAWSDAWLVECCLGETQDPFEEVIDVESARMGFLNALDQAKEYLNDIENEGGVAVFGALCRTSNLLRFTGALDGAVSNVYDDNSSLSGRRLYGTHLIVNDGRELSFRNEPRCLITAINHEEKIEKRHAEYVSSGGNFIRLIDVISE